MNKSKMSTLELMKLQMASESEFLNKSYSHIKSGQKYKVDSLTFREDSMEMSVNYSNEAGISFNRVANLFRERFVEVIESKFRLMIIGHASHGKDTVGDLLCELNGLRSEPSSFFCIRKFLFDKIGTELGYSTPRELYENRLIHRTRLFDEITLYCKDDKARLTREIFLENDIYTGCRSKSQFEASKDQSEFDLVVWVDASLRLPKEPAESMQLSHLDADLIIDNNGTKEELISKVLNLSKLLKQK